MLARKKIVQIPKPHTADPIASQIWSGSALACGVGASEALDCSRLSWVTFGIVGITFDSGCIISFERYVITPFSGAGAPTRPSNDTDDEKLTGTIRRRNTTIHSAQVIQRGARLSTTRSSSTQSAAIPPVTLMLSTVCKSALRVSLLPAIIAQELFNLLRFLAGDSAAF